MAWAVPIVLLRDTATLTTRDMLRRLLTRTPHCTGTSTNLRWKEIVVVIVAPAMVMRGIRTRYPLPVPSTSAVAANTARTEIEDTETAEMIAN